MDNKTIFVATLKGVGEIKNHTRLLSEDIKRVLVLVDDESTVETIMKRVAPNMRAGVGDALRKLETGGFIQDMADAKTSSALRIATPQLNSPVNKTVEVQKDEGEELDFTSSVSLPLAIAETIEKSNLTDTASQLHAEAEARRIHAEQEAEKAKAELELVRLEAEQARAELEATKAAAEALAKQEAETVRLREKETAAKVLAEAEAVRFKAERDTAKAKEELEWVRLDAERTRAELAAAKSTAEALAKSEAEALRIQNEETAAKILAEADILRIKAEQETAQVRAEAEAVRLRAEQETAKARAELEAVLLQAERERAELEVAKLAAAALAKREAEALQQKAQEAAAKAHAEAEVARIAALAKAEQDAIKIKSEADTKAKLEAETARLKAEQEAARIKADFEAAQTKAKAELEAVRLQTERERAELEVAKLAAAALAKKETEALQKRQEADTQAKLEAEAARLKAEQEAARIKAEFEAAQAKAKAELEAVRLQAERERAELEVAKLAATALAKKEAEALQQKRQEADTKAKLEAEAARLKAEQAAARIKADFEAAQAKAKAEAQALAESAALAETKARQEAEVANRRAEQAAVQARLESAPGAITLAPFNLIDFNKKTDEVKEDFTPFPEFMPDLIVDQPEPAIIIETQPLVEIQENKVATQAVEAVTPENTVAAQAVAEQELWQELKAARLKTEKDSDAAQKEKESRQMAEEQAKAWTEAEQRARALALAQAKIDQETQKTEKSQPAPAPRKYHKPLPTGKIVTGLFALLLLLIVGLPYVWPMQRYAKALENELTAQLHQPVHITTLRATILPLPKLELRKVSVGGTEEVKVESVMLHFDVKTLFSKISKIDTMEINDLVLNANAFASALSWLQAAGNIPYYPVAQIFFSKARVKGDEIDLPPLNGRIDWDDQGHFIKSLIKSEDGRFNLELQQQARLKFSLHIKESKLPFLPGILFNEFNAAGDSDMNSIDFTELDGHLFGGYIKGNAQLNWQKDWQMQGHLNIKSMELQQALPKTGLEGEIVSENAFHLNALTPQKLFSSPIINGTFSVGKGIISKMDMVETAANHKGMTGGRTHFEEMSGALQVENNSLHLRQLNIKAGAMTANGYVDSNAEGLVSGRFTVNLKMLAGSSQLVLTGTVNQPELHP
jgi:hypothetical protein